MDRLELEEVGKMISLCRDRVCVEGIGVLIEWPGVIAEEVIARVEGVGVVVEGVGVVVEGVGVAVEGEGVVEGLQVVVEEVIFGVSVVSVTGGQGCTKYKPYSDYGQNIQNLTPAVT